MTPRRGRTVRAWAYRSDRWNNVTKARGLNIGLGFFTKTPHRTSWYTKESGCGWVPVEIREILPPRRPVKRKD